MRSLLSLITCLGLLFGHCAESTACSVFCLRGDERPVFGRNYDWHFGDGMLVVNKRNITKRAIARRRPVTWTSTYGSVTFNQYGREFPCGGMNEAGLVVVVLWHQNAKYPASDRRSAISPLQWVQYQLDTAKDVSDVIQSDKTVRVETISGAKLHYFIGDRTGTCAAVEFIGGKTVYRTGSSLPNPVLTNSTYSTSQAQLAGYEGFGGHKPIGRATSGRRFVRAAHDVRTSDPKADPVEPAFNLLNRIAQGSYTQWNIVYDTARSTIHFRTRAARRTRSIDLTQCNFTPASAVRTLDVNADLSGDVTEQFVPYSASRNRELVTKSFRATPITRNMPRSMLETIAEYPATCKPATSVEAAKDKAAGDKAAGDKGPLVK